MTSSISALGLRLILTGSLQQQQADLGTLTEQLSSGKQHSSLTGYTPTEAKQLLDVQNLTLQRQSYLASIKNVQARLSSYDTTMTDLEKIAAQASSLASQNQSYNTATAGRIQSTAQSYLLQVADDLNQQIGGRYIYAGTRYTTAPVSTDPTVLQGAPQAVLTDGVSLPDYDTQKPAQATQHVTYGATLPSGATVGYTSSATTVQVYDASGTAHTLSYSWSKTATDTWDLTVTAADATYTTVVPFNFDSTTHTMTSLDDYVASGSAPSSYTVASPTGTGVPASVNLSMTFPGQTSAQSFSLDFGTYGQTTGNDALQATGSGAAVVQNSLTQDGKAVTTTNANSYTADTVLVDNGYSLAYGASSNDQSFQQLINGLRYMNAAVTAGQSGDTATYATDMNQALQLISSALQGIQTLHAAVAGNQNTLSAQVTTQNTYITSLTNQLADIQGVDLTDISTKITSLQVQLQASYSATGTLEKLSLVNYL